MLWCSALLLAGLMAAGCSDDPVSDGPVDTAIDDVQPNADGAEDSAEDTVQSCDLLEDGCVEAQCGAPGAQCELSGPITVGFCGDDDVCYEGCSIDGVFYEPGAPSPDDRCMVCDTAILPFAFSPSQDPTCTSGCAGGDGTLCADGVCEGGSCLAKCYIDGVFHEPIVGACQGCDPAVAPLAWTSAIDGKDCHTDALTWGSCQSGSCVESGPVVDPTVCDAESGDRCADTWLATDALGRALPDASQVGAPRADNFVGMFYWIWHETYRIGFYDVIKIFVENLNDPQWGPLHTPHHWSEPELGYYCSKDRYVYRKHASLLADAGVDVLIFDTSNSPFTWPEHYQLLCEVFLDMRAHGEDTPQIAFLTPFWEPSEVVDRLWKDIYEPGYCRELWFEWDGKPLIMADPELIRDTACDGCTGGAGCDAACQGIGQASGSCAYPGSTDPSQCCVCSDTASPMMEFFTFRKPMPSYYNGPSGGNQWGWLEIFPQHMFSGSFANSEQMTVGVAMNGTNTDLKPMSLQTGIHGRSWHNGAKDTGANAVLYGHNFQEQWDRTLAQDPAFVFITGWNEWTAGRYDEWAGVGGGAVFPDQYNHEYSRDIEPMAGGHGDAYYYQLVANIRAYKGVRTATRPSVPRTIAVDGDFSEWDAVRPLFRDTVGDTAHRDGMGYGGLHYVHTSGRNDIVTSRVTYDDENVYFYVQTAAPISPRTDPDWMLLLIDTDNDRSTGWRGYEVVVNNSVASDTTTTVASLPGLSDLGTTEYRIVGNEMEVRVSRSALGLSGEMALSFHWADNTGESVRMRQSLA